jgi:hypothetical protein
LYVRDPILKDIEVNGIETKIIDTQEFQRLRHINQLGFTNLVYPSANSTRFEHSLGVMRITKDLAAAAGFKADEELALAGLLHDIGHTPFSHQTEHVFMQHLGKTHERLGYDIIKNSPISDIASENGISLKKILSYFNGVGKGKIITGSLGSDRIDYLQRDAYHTGVASGVADYTRIRNKLAFFNGVPAVYRDGTDGAESMLVARYYMFSAVYFHHASVIADGMFSRALAHAIESGEVDPREAARFTDGQLTYALSKSKAGSKLATMVAERRLFKRVYYFDGIDGPGSVHEIDSALGKAGFEPDGYVAELRQFKGGDDDVAVIGKDGKKLGNLSSISPLFNTLLAMLKKRRIIVVACDRKDVDRAKKAVSKAL